MPCAMAYLATWIGWNSLRLDNFSHNVDPSFHLQQMYQPAVDFLRVSHPLMTTFWSLSLKAEPFFLWSMNVSNNRYSFLWTSYWAYLIVQWCLLPVNWFLPQEILPHKGVYQKWGSNWIYQWGYHWHHASGIPIILWLFWPLLGAISQCSHIGPLAQGLSLVHHPTWKMWWHYASCPHMGHTVGCPPLPVQPSLSTQYENPASGIETPWTSNIWPCTFTIPILHGSVLGPWTYAEPDRFL